METKPAATKLPGKQKHLGMRVGGGVEGPKDIVQIRNVIDKDSRKHQQQREYGICTKCNLA